LRKSKRIKVLDSKTKNFDSFLRDIRLKEISLIKKVTFKDKIKTLYASKNIFEKKVLFSKYFFKKLFLFLFLAFVLLGINGLFIKSFIESGYTKLLSLSST
jgi:hypothetical protein